MSRCFERARPGYPLGRVPQMPLKCSQALHAAEKPSLCKTLDRFVTRARLQPGLKPQHETAGFSPCAIFPAQLKPLAPFSAACLAPERTLKIDIESLLARMHSIEISSQFSTVMLICLTIEAGD